MVIKTNFILGDFMLSQSFIENTTILIVHPKDNFSISGPLTHSTEEQNLQEKRGVRRDELLCLYFAYIISHSGYHCLSALHGRKVENFNTFLFTIRHTEYIWFTNTGISNGNWTSFDI